MNSWEDMTGYFSQADYDLFYKLFEPLPDFVCVLEIGSLTGKSACATASILKEQNKEYTIHCMDSWINKKRYNEFLENTKNDKWISSETLLHRKPMRWNDYTQPHGAYDFIYIDAAHDMVSTLKNMEKWHLHLDYKGIMMVDDYNFPPVNQAVSMFENKYNKKFEKTFAKVWLVNE